MTCPLPFDQKTRRSGFVSLTHIFFKSPAVSPVIKPAVAFVFALTLIIGAVGTMPAQARPTPDGFTELAERLLPSVVNISITQEVRSPFANGENGDIYIVSCSYF